MGTVHGVHVANLSIGSQGDFEDAIHHVKLTIVLSPREQLK